MPEEKQGQGQVGPNPPNPEEAIPWWYWLVFGLFLVFLHMRLREAQKERLKRLEERKKQESQVKKD